MRVRKHSRTSKKGRRYNVRKHHRINKPFKSNRKHKKLQVYVKDKDGNIKNVHFGDNRYEHNYSEEARVNYLKRSAGIRNKQGRLTKDDKTSANYWSRKVLWDG